jgi:quinoprotein glucose dehydrogenase
VAGIYFSGGGIWLLTKGGSPYYLVAGIAFVAVGVLLVLRNPWALWMYTAIILGTMVWALWEVGIDWWQLAPRGDVVVILGVFLSWPWVAVGAKSANGRD